MKISVFVILLTFANFSQETLMDWLYYPLELMFGKSTETSLYRIENEDALLNSIQFEADNEYDRFLSEAQTMAGVKLSELDLCQHKVIMKIKSSCASLTDDDIGRLGINMLNCKLSEERKLQFICTTKMSVEDCTKNMDSEMWNEYGLMKDQARTFCFSVRQQLFKAMTEMVVNRLMHSSQEQLKSMKVLQDGHNMMLQQQNALREAQDAVSASLESHMGNLEKEKALVLSGHDEIANIVEGMHKRLNAASSEMDALLTARKANHNKLVKNINSLQQQVRVLLDQIDHSVQLVKDQNEEIAAKYKAAIESLAQINSTVNYLMGILEMTQNELDAWAKWMSSILGGTGDHVAVLLAFALHLGYLLLGMVAMAFLGAPVSSRLFLLILVPFNYLLVINPSNAATETFPYALESMKFSTLTVVILLFTMGNMLLVYMFNICQASNMRNDKLMGNQYLERPTRKVIHSPGIDGSNQSYFHKKMANVLKILDPRYWWTQGEVNNAKGSWSKNLPSQTYKSDVDDSSDTDGPLVIEKDDEDDYDVDSEAYSSQNFDKSFSTQYRKNYIRNDISTNVHPLSTSLQEKPRRSVTPKSVCGAICQSGQRCRNICLNGHVLCHRHYLGMPGRG